MGFVFHCFDIDIYSTIKLTEIQSRRGRGRRRDVLMSRLLGFRNEENRRHRITTITSLWLSPSFGLVSPKLSTPSRSNTVSRTPRLEEQAKNLSGCFLSRLSNSGEDGGWRGERPITTKGSVSLLLFRSPQARLSL
jgi:hypothetical protein